ncbi:MAG: translational GTPase TypA, partial [Planctomycetota bacterium]
KILSATRGEATLHTALAGYDTYRGEIPERAAGVIVAQEEGTATAYALDSLRSRGTFFVVPGTRVYEGMIVGEHVHERDMIANVARTRKLTNMRAASADAAVVLDQARIFSLEEALEFINSDEHVEVTPRALRLRKKLLKRHQRKRAAAR